MPNYTHRSLPADSEVIEPSAEEKASLKFAAEAMEKMANLMQRKTDQCVHCGQPVQRLKKVGRSVYAYPCGCRLWQGTVPDAWKDKPASNSI